MRSVGRLPVFDATSSVLMYYLFVWPQGERSNCNQQSQMRSVLCSLYCTVQFLIALYDLVLEPRSRRSLDFSTINTSVSWATFPLSCLGACTQPTWSYPSFPPFPCAFTGPYLYRRLYWLTAVSFYFHHPSELAALSSQFVSAPSCCETNLSVNPVARRSLLLPWGPVSYNGVSTCST